MALADGVQIQQVVLNLVVNAIEAMRENGAADRILRLAVHRSGKGTAPIGPRSNSLPASSGVRSPAGSDTIGALRVPADVPALVVYIVDDDASVRTGLARLIRSAGFEPRVFASPEEFLGEVKNEHPACVLLAITMPRGSGAEVLSPLKEQGIDLPAIAVSGRDDDETRRLARERGARFFLRKRVDGQALLDAVAWVTHSGGATSPE